MEQSEKTLPKLDLLLLMRDMLPLVRRFWMVGLALAVTLGLFFGIKEKINYRPVYEASASFTVKVVNPLYAGANGYNAETVEQMEKTFPYILSSNALREHVKKELGITALPLVQADAIDGTNVFTLRVRDADPKRAYDVLNTVIACYPRVSEFVIGPTKMVLLDESGLPVHPLNAYSVILSAAMGVVLGVAIWLAFLLALAMTRNTVRNEDDLKQMLNCPCLGVLPFMKVVGKNAVCPMLTQEHGIRRFADAMQLVQLHVETKLKKHRYQVVLVSSALPHEGKTTVSSNLAISLAQKGNRVLLIDTDLRNPSVGKAFHVRNERGLLEYMEGYLEVKELLKKTDIPELYLITAGRSRKKNAADQVADQRLTAIIHATRKLFDYVILDTAPCGLLADASELAETADCAVMVVRQDYASRSQIIDGARFLVDSKLPLIGAVLNGTKQDEYSQYGYGYGYGNR